MHFTHVAHLKQFHRTRQNTIHNFFMCRTRVYFHFILYDFIHFYFSAGRSNLTRFRETKLRYQAVVRPLSGIQGPKLVQDRAVPSNPIRKK